MSAADFALGKALLEFRLNLGGLQVRREAYRQKCGKFEH